MRSWIRWKHCQEQRQQLNDGLNWIKTFKETMKMLPHIPRYFTNSLATLFIWVVSRASIIIGTIRRSEFPLITLTTNGRCISIECSLSSTSKDDLSKWPVLINFATTAVSTFKFPMGVSRSSQPLTEHLFSCVWWEGPRRKMRLTQCFAFSSCNLQ